MRRILRMLLFCATLYVARANQCFYGDALPSFFFKASPFEMKDDRWTAIEANENSNRVFLGGKFQDSANYWANTGDAVTYKPVAACWDVDDKRYLWTKRLIDTSGHFGEVQAIGLNHDKTTLIVTGVTKTVSDNKRFIYFLNAQTGTHVQDALILTLTTQIEHTNRYQIVTNVPNRLYLTGMASRTVNSGAGGFSDKMQLIAIDYSSTPQILAHYTNNAYSGSITAAMTLDNSFDSERILLGAGYTPSTTNAQYVLAILQYWAVPPSGEPHFKGLDFHYNQPASVYTSASNYQTVELMKRDWGTDFICLTTRNRDYTHPGENSMVAMIKLKENHYKLDYDKAWWVKWTNSLYSNTRVLALTKCDSASDELVAGVSYDDSYQHFVYWQVKLVLLDYKADSYYPGTTFVQAAAFYDWENVSGDHISYIPRCFLAGYATAYTNFDSPPNLYGIESPMLMDSLGFRDMCYKQSIGMSGLGVTAVSITTQHNVDLYMALFPLPHTPTSSVTTVDYRSDDLVHAYKLPGTNFCIDEPSSDSIQLSEVQPPTYYDQTFYTQGNLGTAMACDIDDFVITEVCTDVSQRWEYSIEYTGASIPAQDIVHYDTLSKKLIFNVRSTLVTAGTYQIKLHGSLPNGVSTSVVFNLNVVNSAGTNACTVLTCPTSTTNYVLTTTQTIPTQNYNVGDAQASVPIDDFSLSATDVCGYDDADFQLRATQGPSESIFTLESTYAAGPPKTWNLVVKVLSFTNADAGTYTVTVTATMATPPLKTDGTLQFTYIVHPTCYGDATTTVSSTQTFAKEVYYVNQPTVTKYITPFTVTSSQCTSADVVYSATTTPSTASLFVVDQAQLTLSWMTTNYADVGLHTVTLKGSIMSVSASDELSLQSFTVDIQANCFYSVDSFALTSGTCSLPDITYTTGDPTVYIDFSGFTESAAHCDESDIVYSLSGAPAFLTIDSSNNLISLHTDDRAYEGEYTISIMGTISRYSVTDTVSDSDCSFVLTVKSPICVIAETQLDVSGLTDVTYSVGTGPARIVLSLSDNVDGLCWKTWSYQLFINGDSPIEITLTSSSDPKLTFDSKALQLQVETKLPYASSLPLLLIASREDGPNFARGTFNLNFEVEANNAPFFEQGYILNATQVNVTATQVSSFELGASYDPENDAYTCKLDILPSQAMAYFNLDCKTGQISYERESLLALASESSDQLIQVIVTTLDQNEIVPMSNKYTFNFLIAKLPSEVNEESSAETVDFVPNLEKIEAVVERRIRFISMRPTQNGNFDVYFSEPVYNPENLTVIDPLMLRLELLSQSDFKADQLAFSWQIIDFTRNMMRIEVTWADPLYISALEPDTLRVTALENAYLGFQGVSSTPETYVTLQDGTTIENTVPRQLGGSQEEMAVFMEQVQALGTAAKSAVAGGLVVNLLLASTLSLLWNLVNVLQVITHLSFMSTLMPQNALMFNEVLLAAANLDVLPMDAIYEVIFPFLYTNGVDMSRQLQEEDDDVEESPLAEVGNFLFSLMLLFSLVPILILVRIFGIKQQWVSELRGLIFWSATLQVFIESYLEILLSCFLALSIGLKWETWVDKFLSGFTYTTIFAFILAPTGISLFLSMRVSLFREKSFKTRFGSVIENLNFRRKISPWFLSLFCYRRLLLVLLIVYMGSSGYAQVMLICQTSAIGIIILGTINPIHLPIFRRMEMLNESMILVCIYHYFCFTTFVESPVVREQVGQSLIRVILFVLFSNIYLMVTFMVSRAVFLLKKFRGYLHRKRAKLFRRSSRQKKKAPPSQHSEESSEPSQESQPTHETELRWRNKRRRRRNEQHEAFGKLDRLPEEESKEIQHESTLPLRKNSHQRLIAIPTVLLQNDVDSSEHELPRRQNLSVIEEEECDFDSLQMQIDHQMAQMWNDLAAIQYQSTQHLRQDAGRNQNTHLDSITEYQK